MIDHKSKAKLSLGNKMNVEYVLRDAEGNVKPMFQENGLCRFLLKNSVLNPHWINSKIASFLMPFLGRWSDKRMVSNLITNAGMAGVASRINGSGAEAAFTYIGVGTGTTAAAVGNTTLETEIVDSGLDRAAATAARTTVDVTNDAATLAKTFSVTGTKAVTESGVFNAVSGGVLLARQVFSAVNVVSGDSLAITWTIDVD